tara:strand:+ start:593 stop:772 length:180 start_codon:yes stop_codon:yes gene_type:complete
MKPDKEEIQKMMDQVKEIGEISLDIIYSSEKTNDKAKLINKKAYQIWVKLAKMSDRPKD